MAICAGSCLCDSVTFWDSTVRRSSNRRSIPTFSCRPLDHLCLDFLGYRGGFPAKCNEWTGFDAITSNGNPVALDPLGD